MANQKSNDKSVNVSDLNKSQILALDIATHTGFFSSHSHGTWNFTESKRRNNNKQHKDFRDTLMSYITDNKIKLIVAEDINVNNYFSDMRKLSEFRGILFEICDQLDLPEPHFVNVSTLKKWATGNGRAKKPEMMEACRVKYNFEPTDDNEADACHIYHYFVRKHRIV